MFTRNIWFYLIDHQGEQRQGSVDRKVYGNIIRLSILRNSTLQLPELERLYRLFSSVLSVSRVRMLWDAEWISCTDKANILLSYILLCIRYLFTLSSTLSHFGPFNNPAVGLVLNLHFWKKHKSCSACPQSWCCGPSLPPVLDQQGNEHIIGTFVLLVK